MQKYKYILLAGLILTFGVVPLAQEIESRLDTSYIASLLSSLYVFYLIIYFVDKRYQKK